MSDPQDHQDLTEPLGVDPTVPQSHAPFDPSEGQAWPSPDAEPGPVGPGPWSGNGGPPPAAAPNPGWNPGAPGYGDPGYPAPGGPGYGPPGYAPPGYASPGYPGGYAYGGVEHSQATLSLVLAIVGAVGTFLCVVPWLVSPVAWYLGAKAEKEIDAAPGQYRNRGQAEAGKIVGMVATLVGLVLIAAVVVLLVVAGASSS